MVESTKIDFRFGRISQIDDITDLLNVFFPGNQNQQHAAAQIILVLKQAEGVVASLSSLRHRHGISRRTLERTRGKLARLGLIEHVTWMNSRYGGQQGWKLSGRMSGSLRLLADKIGQWRDDTRPERRDKDDMLAQLLRP